MFGMIAMIPNYSFIHRVNVSSQEPHANSDIRVHVPAVNHVFVKPRYRFEILEQAQLEIPRRVKPYSIVVGHNLFKMKS